MASGKKLVSRRVFEKGAGWQINSSVKFYHQFARDKVQLSEQWRRILSEFSLLFLCFPS